MDRGSVVESAVLERGSVLMLMPAAVLVFIVLGAIAVDFGVIFLAEREVANTAVAAANDAASVAVDVGGFYGEDEVRLRSSSAVAVAEGAVADEGLDHLDDVQAVARVLPGAPRVQVTVRARAPLVFSAALPGGPDSVEVEATAVASAEEEP